MSTPAAPQAPLTLAEGQARIKDIPLGSPFAADAHLGELLDHLLAQPPAPDVLFALLEELRAPLGRILHTLADEYRNKLLPLEVDQRATFLTVIHRWQQMARAYAQAADSLRREATDLQAEKLQATLQQRALHYIGRELFEHYVGRQEVPAGLWLKLHQGYALAEGRGQDHTPLDDASETTQHQTHCSATYIASLLIEMAGPYGHGLRNLELVRRWAMDWAALVSIQPLDDDLEAPPYVVRLDQDKPLHLFGPTDEGDTHVRHLDCARLGLQINHLLGQLQTRITPAQLGLGDEPAYQVRPLLTRLFRPWTQAASPRKFRRFASTASARATSGFPAMHYAIAGQDFIQPDPSIGYSRQAAEGMYTFGQSAGTAPGSHASEAHYHFDEWQVLNHSANGFRLARNGTGERLALGQALAVCPHDGENFLLCRINWLMEETTGGLVVGVSVLGGLPQAIGLRNAGTHDRFERAFLLPASPVTREAASLLLPPGLYVPRGELELLNGEHRQTVCMAHVIERGVDFDRITFESA